MSRRIDDWSRQSVNSKALEDMDKIVDVFEERIASFDSYDADFNDAIKETEVMLNKIEVLKKALKEGQVEINGKMQKLGENEALIRKGLADLVEDYVYAYNTLLSQGAFKGNKMTKNRVLADKSFNTKTLEAVEKRIKALKFPEVKIPYSKEDEKVVKQLNQEYKKLQDIITNIYKGKKPGFAGVTTLSQAENSKVAESERLIKKVISDVTKINEKYSTYIGNMQAKSQIKNNAEIADLQKTAVKITKEVTQKELKAAEKQRKAYKDSITSPREKELNKLLKEEQKQIDLLNKDLEKAAKTESRRTVGAIKGKITKLTHRMNAQKVEIDKLHGYVYQPTSFKNNLASNPSRKFSDEELVDIAEIGSQVIDDLKDELAGIRVRSDIIQKSGQRLKVNKQNTGRIGFSKAASKQQKGSGLFFDFPALKGWKTAEEYEKTHAAGGKAASQVEEEFKKQFAALSSEWKKSVSQQMLRSYANGHLTTLVKALIDNKVLGSQYFGETGITPFVSADGYNVDAATINGLYAKDLVNLYGHDPKLALKFIEEAVKTGQIDPQFRKELAATEADSKVKEALLSKSGIIGVKPFISRNKNYVPPKTVSKSFGNFYSDKISASKARILAKEGFLVPTLVSLEDKGHIYSFRTNQWDKEKNKYKPNEDYETLFGVDQSLFHSGSKANPVGKEKDFGPHAGDAGTIFHQLLEWIAKGKFSADELLDRKNKITFEGTPLREYFAKKGLETDKIFTGKNGWITKTAENALKAASEKVEGAKIAIAEKSIGAIANILGEEQAIVATIDNLTEEANEYVVKDYKFRHSKSVSPFDEYTQLSQEAALINVNRANLGLDPNKQITKGQILQYQIDKEGKEVLRNYNLPTVDEFMKFQELSQQYKSGKIGLNDFIKGLPEGYKKAYADQYYEKQGGVYQYRGNGPVQISYRDPNTKKMTHSNLFFGGEKGGASVGNELFTLYKTDPAAVDKILHGVFAHPELIPQEYLNILGGAMYNASLAGNDPKVGLSEEEFKQKRGFIEMVRGYLPSSSTGAGKNIRYKEINKLIENIGIKKLVKILDTESTTKKLSDPGLIPVEKLQALFGKTKGKKFALTPDEYQYLSDYYLHNILFSGGYQGENLYAKGLLPERFMPRNDARGSFRGFYSRLRYESTPEDADEFIGKESKVRQGFSKVKSKLLSSGSEEVKNLLKRYKESGLLLQQARLSGNEEDISRHESAQWEILNDLFPADEDEIRHMHAGNMSQYTVEQYNKLIEDLHKNKHLSENDKSQLESIWRRRLFGNNHDLDFSIARGFGRAYFAPNLLPSGNLTPEQQLELSWGNKVKGTMQGIASANKGILLEDATKQTLASIATEFGLGDFINTNGRLTKEQTDTKNNLLAKVADKYGNPARSLMARFLVANNNEGWLGDDFAQYLFTAFGGYEGQDKGSIVSNFNRKDKYGNTGVGVLLSQGATLGETWLDQEENAWKVGSRAVGQEESTEAAQKALDVEKEKSEVLKEEAETQREITAEEQKQAETVEEASESKEKFAVEKKTTEELSIEEAERKLEVNEYGEKQAQRVQQIYDKILSIDKQILNNKQSIAALSSLESNEARNYKKTLEDQNKILEQQKNKAAGKLVAYQKAGIVLSPFGQEYAANSAVLQAGAAFKAAGGMKPQKNQSGGGNTGGNGKPPVVKGGFQFGNMGRTSWYSLDGRVLHWIERMLNGGMWLSFFNTMRKGLKTLINLSKDLDKYMTNIRIVTGATREQAQTLTGSFIQLSQKLGVTAEEVLKSATEFYRQGYQTAEVENLVASATKLSRLGMIDMTKSVQDITSAMKGFKLSTEQSIDVVDKLTAIDMKAAVSAGEIAEGLAQFANLANVNGVDLDQAAAYVATIAEVTQKGGSSTGSALKMIMSRYGNVKAGAYNKLNVDTENTDTSQDLNDVEKVLKKLGISIRDANLNFKDFDVILDEIAERWNDLDNVTKRAIATSFAGTRQQEQFLTLMENYDKYRKLLDVSRNSAGTADKKYESYLDSYEAAKNELQNAVKELANNSQINKILTDITKGITKIFKNVVPWLMRNLPFFMHILLDIRTLMGKSVIQTVGGKLINFASGGGFWQGIANARGGNVRSTGGSYTTTPVRGYGYNTSAGSVPLAYTWNSGSTSTSGVSSYGSGYSTSYLTSGSNYTTSTSGGSGYALATDGNYTYNTGSGGGTSVSTKGMKVRSANKAKGGGNAGAVLFGISMLMNSLTSAVTALQTSGATHKNAEGEYVESSAAAQKKAGSVAAVLAFLPFGIGSLIDGLFGISDKIAANADREKDAAESATKHAETIISSLNNMGTKLTQIESYGIGSDNFNKALNEMLVDLYSKDNEEARKALEDVIGGPGELRGTINKIKTGTEQQAKAALRTLKIAELEAKKEKIQNKYATQKYNNQTDISKKFAAVNNYEGENHAGDVIGLGLGGATAGALTGLTAVGLTNAWNPVGLAILIATAVAGAGIGIYAGAERAKAQKELEKRQYEKETAWGRMSTSQKILDTQEKLDKAIEEGNGEYAGQLQELLDALNTQNALTNQIVDEMNEIALEQAFIGAVYKDEKGNETALQDMSVAQLKNLGVDKILAIYGQATLNSGIIGQNFFDKNGNLTESGYTYLLSKLRSQGDDEISSVLSGGAYTLREALALKDKFPDSIYVDRLLQSFATSLNTTVDGLGDLEGALGSLHLAETYLSTTELSDKLNSYTGLLDSISAGAGNTSEWMNTIINQFPELIAYMGDTSTLFDKITEKVGALSKQYINAQYASVSSSADAYNAIREDFYKKIDNEDITAALDKANVTSIEGVIEFLRGEYGSDGQLTKTGETVKKALTDTVDEFGLSITSSVLKGYYDKVIEFKTKVLDTEIKNLNEQKEALQNINKQREYENQLIEAKLKLENASKEKKRVYRAGVGWVYEADQEAIAKAQTEYDQLQNQKTVSDLEMQIATLENEKNKLNSIYDEQNYETLSDFYTSYMKTTDESLSLYSNIAEGITGISVNLSELVEGAAKADQENKDKAVSAAKKAWEELQGVAPGSAGYNGADYNTALEAYHTAYNAAVGAGMTEEDTKGWGNSSIAGHSGKQGAWAVGGGALEKQKVSPSLHFKLPDPSNGSKSFEGTADWSATQYDPKIHEWILKDIQKNNAYIWLPGQSTAIIPDKDSRFKYKKDKSFTDYIQRMKEQGINEFVVTGYDGGQESAYVKDGVIYRIVGHNAADDPNGLSRVSGGVSSPIWAEPFYETYAKGTLGVSLVNELGTEAIVTPHGTITALPSRTGVVPADITKNLWELGKVAPSIMRTLELQMRDITLKGAGLGNTDESFNVGTINMTVNADGTFDADAFVESVKMRASLTRNTNR